MYILAEGASYNLDEQREDMEIVQIGVATTKMLGVDPVGQAVAEFSGRLINIHLKDLIIYRAGAQFTK